MNWDLNVYEEQESVFGEVSIVYGDRHLTKYDKSQVYEGFGDSRKYHEV